MERGRERPRPRLTANLFGTPWLCSLLLVSQLTRFIPPLSSPQLTASSKLKAKVAELEAETEKLRYRVERLGCSLKERRAAARAALEELEGDRGLRSRLGRVLFGKYYYEEGEE